MLFSSLSSGTLISSSLLAWFGAPAQCVVVAAKHLQSSCPVTHSLKRGRCLNVGISHIRSELDRALQVAGRFSESPLLKLSSTQPIPALSVLLIRSDEGRQGLVGLPKVPSLISLSGLIKLRLARPRSGARLVQEV